MADIVVTTGGNSVTNGTNFQTALDSANPGDRVILTAGATYDGTFTLADKGATSGTPITITTNNAGSLPNGRVGPANVGNMAKIRTLGGGGGNPAAFLFAASAGWWIIDGLEITDNADPAITIHSLINASNGSEHDIVIKRCYFHNKETGTDYHRSIRWGAQWEGSGLTFKWNYVHLIGYYQPEVGLGSNYALDTMAVGCVGGNTVTMDDNYISTWYVAYFTGGGDTLGQNTASLTSSSNTSATFSNTTGITAGLYIRLDMTGTGTLARPGGGLVLTVTSGPTFTNDDIYRVMTINDGVAQGAMGRITAVSGSDVTMDGHSGGWQGLAEGSVTFVFYAVVKVDSVVSSTVNYTAFGVDGITAGKTPNGATWNYGDQGLVYDFNFLRNTVEIDFDFANHVKTNILNQNVPKGYMEVKSAKRMTIDGNRFIGYPSVLGFSAANQTGKAPWITTQDVTITNNWYYPTYISSDTTGPIRQFLIAGDNQYYHSNTPSANYLVSNNLSKNHMHFADLSGVTDVEISHNTIFNASSGSGYYAAVSGQAGADNPSFVFKDNIVSYWAYGMICFIGGGTLAECWPSGTFSKNVVIDVQSIGFSTSVWGAGSALSPIPTSFDDVGFVNAAADNYELDLTSDYKGAGNGGTDPGVDWAALQAALAGATESGGRKVKKGRVIRGRH